MGKSLTDFLRKVAIKIPAVFLVTASAGFGCVYAYGQGSQHGVLLALLSVSMAVGFESSKPLAVFGAVQADLTWPSRLALGVLALVACAYSLTAEVSLVAANRQAANAVRAGQATQQTVAKDTLARAKSELAANGVTKPVADVEAELAVIKLDRTWQRTVECSNVTLDASRSFCTKAAAVTAEMEKAKRADELRKAIQSAEASLMTTAGVDDADPGAAAVVVYLAAIGARVDSAAVSRGLVLVAVLALEIGSLFAGVLASALAGSVPATLDVEAVKKNTSVANANTDRTLVDPVSSNKPDSQPGQIPNSTGHSVRERLITRLKVAGGSLVQSTRELAFSLGCSKSALGEVLARLESEGVLVRVAASHGKGSAIRLVGEMVAQAGPHLGARPTSALWYALLNAGIKHTCR
jgi:biotin operon repressor